VNTHSFNRNSTFIYTENTILQKTERYLEKKGWKTIHEIKLRGRIVDIIAVKDGKIMAIEIKGGSGDTQQGIEQALHQKNAVNFSYLAIPKDRSSEVIQNSCQNLGLGLLLINDRVEEIVKPVMSEALPSVRNLVFKEKKKSQKVVSIKSSLENLFRNRAMILILKLLLLNSSNEFHGNDIARKSGLAPSTVAKEMPLIYNMGLVQRRIQGNLVFYKINNKSIIFSELKRIFLKFEMLDEVISKELPKEDIRYALIYGSFAKGTESQSSDIDLLIIGDVNDNTILRSISKTEGKLGREVNYILWTEEEFLDKVEKKIPLIKEISKTPIIMITGDENEFKRLIEAR
jgi:predicted nucleotidyltransferase/predicted RecB family endonuclease